MLMPNDVVTACMLYVASDHVTLLLFFKCTTLYLYKITASLLEYIGRPSIEGVDGDEQLRIENVLVIAYI